MINGNNTKELDHLFNFIQFFSIILQNNFPEKTA